MSDDEHTDLVPPSRVVTPNDDPTALRPQYAVARNTAPNERSRLSPQYQIPSKLQSQVTTAASSGTPIIEDEGVMRTVRAIINFVGGGVSAVDNPTYGRTDVTISSAPAFATPNIALSTAAAAGAAATVIRSDATIVAFDATVPSTQAFGDAAATGSAPVAARRDHKHGMPASTAPSFASLSKWGR